MLTDFDEKTMALLADKNEMLVSDLHQGFIMRAQARQMEDKAKEITKRANTILAAVLCVLDPTESLIMPQYGSISFVQNIEQKSMSRDKEEKYLLEHGVPPEMISRAREAATTVKTQEYQIKFTPVKNN